VGCAPDTFLGGAHQTCIKLINDGVLGEPVGVTGMMLGHGAEGWHPNPGIFYQHGAGPMLDMGPYYLTTMIALLGPVWRTTGSSRISFPERTITSEPLKGQKIEVEVPTHITGIMDFANGAIGTLTTSFDVWQAKHPNIEVYGSEGTLIVPDPNGPGGTPLLWTPATNEWQEVPLTHGYTETSRSTGVADLAYALRYGREHRASGQLAFHVLDLMLSFQEASEADRHIAIDSTVERPAPLPVGLREGTLDE
jgi:predicted dehydrogenase